MIRKATSSDAAAIQNLIRVYAEDGKMLFRTLAEIRQHIRSFLVSEKDGEIVGICSLKYGWDHLVEIRSLGVDPRHMGQGIGTGLVRRAVEEALTTDCETIFVLTYAVPLFLKLGFQVVDMSTLPMKVWSDCQGCLHKDHCDETAMTLSLTALKNRSLSTLPLKSTDSALY